MTKKYLTGIAVMDPEAGGQSQRQQAKGSRGREVPSGALTLCCSVSREMYCLQDQRVTACSPVGIIL